MIHLGRYDLQDLISIANDDPAVAFWRGHDTVLDREVTVRLLDATDPRAAAFLGAARAAALVEDRRLVRILDILQVAATPSSPQRIAVVSEWVRGRSLEQLMRDREWQPLAPDEAITLVDEVARAIAAGEPSSVSHGRLRAASVIVTDAGEVRVRGLAVDAALWGPLTPGLSKQQADVDGLGSLLFLLTTGMWPGEEVGMPTAPTSGGHVLPPSRIVAGIPRAVDDLVSRSVHTAERPRGLTNIPDVAGFVAVLGVTRDHLAPTAVAARPRRPVARALGRLLAVGLGAAVAIAIAVVGWQLIVSGPSAWSSGSPNAAASLLTASVAPSPTAAGIEQTRPVVSVQSWDPFGDDNKNGKPDGRKGRENDADAAAVIDGIPTTSWTSDRYASADLDGKGGVGLILDLGQSTPVRSVQLAFDGPGTATQVRVADRLYRDPATWNLLTAAPAGGSQITLRGARPITGRYVLIWFPQVPELPEKPGRFRVAVSGLTVTG